MANVLTDDLHFFTTYYLMFPIMILILQEWSLAKVAQYTSIPTWFCLTAHDWTETGSFLHLALCRLLDVSSAVVSRDPSLHCRVLVLPLGVVLHVQFGGLSARRATKQRDNCRAREGVGDVRAMGLHGGM
jgi:hypothetical protein